MDRQIPGALMDAAERASREGLADTIRNAPEVPRASEDEARQDPPKRKGTSSRKSNGGKKAPPPTARKRGEIYPNCPVTALGVEGEHSFYLDALGQLRGIDNHTAQKIQHLFGDRIEGLCREFPQFDKDGGVKRGRFDQTKASMAMINACAEMGVWSPANRVRGAGAWVDDDGALVWHAGNEVLIGGEWRPPGVYDGRVYSASQPVPRPETVPAGSDPAAELLEYLRTWCWRRIDIDPQLVLGLVCAQMLGGALDWRPVAWLTGDAATGKSTFQKSLLYLHGGETGLMQAADATEAGIRSLVGHSSLPVAIDELEPDKDNPTKVKSVVELARRAASGAKIFRGSADQKGHQSNAYSCFLFSSILVPAMPAQDRSRLIVLDLDPLPPDAPRFTLDPRKLRTSGGRLRRLLIGRWPTWTERLELWRGALAVEGQVGRAADNYATVLAMADMAVQRDLPTEEQLQAWARLVNVAETRDSVDLTTNAEDMLFTLMGKYHDPFRRGERFTVAQWVMAAAMLPGAPPAITGGEGTIDQLERSRAANESLAKIGLRVQGKGTDAKLFIANKPIPALCEIMRDTDWADGVWSQAARRVPGAEASKHPLTLSGLRSRGVSIPFDQLPGLAAFPMDRQAQSIAPGPAPGASDFPPEDFA